MSKVQAVNLVNVSEAERNEAIELEKRLEQAKLDRERLAQIKKKAKGVTMEKIVTQKGPVGFRINGLGIPKFFYKQQALALLADNDEAKATRQLVLDWMVEHNEELTDKE